MIIMLKYQEKLEDKEEHRVINYSQKANIFVETLCSVETPHNRRYLLLLLHFSLFHIEIHNSSSLQCSSHFQADRFVWSGVKCHEGKDVFIYSDVLVDPLESSRTRSEDDVVDEARASGRRRPGRGSEEVDGSSLR